MKKIAVAALTLLASTVYSFDASVPVVNLDDYKNPEKKEQFLKDLKAAMSDLGFFAVTNSMIDSKILDRGYEESEKFFRKDFLQKMEINVPNIGGQRGYVPSESAKGEDLLDFKEFLHIGRELNEEQLARLNYCPNYWPEEGDLKEATMDLFNALRTFSEPLEQAFSELLHQEKDFLKNMTDEGDVLLRSIHYPAKPPANTIWAAEHTDIDLYTILPRSTAKGLQVRNKDGEWVYVMVPENAFVVNVGDMLESLSNGLFRSGPHRVIDPGLNQERFSMVLFVHPKSEDGIGPLDACIEETGGVRKFAYATRWELLVERLVDLELADTAMMEFLRDSGFLERVAEVGRTSENALSNMRKAGVID